MGFSWRPAKINSRGLLDLLVLVVVWCLRNYPTVFLFARPRWWCPTILDLSFFLGGSIWGKLVSGKGYFYLFVVLHICIWDLGVKKAIFGF